MSLWRRRLLMQSEVVQDGDEPFYGSWVYLAKSTTPYAIEIDPEVLEEYPYMWVRYVGGTDHMQFYSKHPLYRVGINYGNSVVYDVTCSATSRIATNIGRSINLSDLKALTESNGKQRYGNYYTYNGTLYNLNWCSEDIYTWDSAYTI